jgi:hypothetical protein
MLLPEPPVVVPLTQISPSVYEASLTCVAKATWFAGGDRRLFPEHPAALLGTAIHAVVAAAHRRVLRVEGKSDRDAARALFDLVMQRRHQEAHALLRLKFPSPERLPYYNLRREQAALLAARVAETRAGNVVAARADVSNERLPRTEAWLRSKDGVIVGRPDYIDAAGAAVVDYKSGQAPEQDGGATSDSEARQLRLYAYLAAQNGVRIANGQIIRSDGHRCDLAITAPEADAEADNARRQLSSINELIASTSGFAALASPSGENCRSCPCIPFCEAFWAAATPDWQEKCGVHISGRISAVDSRVIQGVAVTTLVVDSEQGTAVEAKRKVAIEQIPSEWIPPDELQSIRDGALVRVTHGRQIVSEKQTMVIRPDRVMTAVWFDVQMQPQRSTPVESRG